MAVRDIITIPDPLLRKASLPVERFDSDLHKLLDDMADTMYQAPGIGLAAVQIGIPLRIFVTDTGMREKEEEMAADSTIIPLSGEGDASGGEERDQPGNPLFFINPEIVELSGGPSLYNEGCLSIPEYYAEVERPANVVVKFLDRFGKQQILAATGLQSTCIQHEYDHLEGRLFIDLMSKLKRDMVVRKFTKLARQQGKII